MPAPDPKQIRNEADQELPDSSASFLTHILDMHVEADMSIRQDYLARWQLNQLYWDGEQDIYFDHRHSSWRSISDNDEYIERDDDDVEDTSTGAINFYRSRGESIIAAMTNSIPATQFFPDDADDPSDIATAKTFSHASELIQRQNDSEQQDIEIATNMWLFGKCYGYTYPESNPAFGKDRISWDEERSIPMKEMVCEECGLISRSEQIDAMPEKNPEEPPEGELDDPEVMDDSSLMEEEHCPRCGVTSIFKETFSEKEKMMPTFGDVPATRQIVEIVSPVRVSVAPWSKNIRESPYLILYERKSVSKARAMWPEHAEQIMPVDSVSNINQFESDYLSLGARFETPDNTTLLRHVWLRPWAFDPQEAESEEDETPAEDCMERFPNGCYMLFNGDELLFARAENVDDYWAETDTKVDPRGLPQALGDSFINVQNLISENVSLIRNSILHSVPITFADTEVFDQEEYAKSYVQPGDITPATSTDGSPLGHHFHSAQTANIPRGTEQFISFLDEAGQTVVADHPSIHGGAGGGSKTFGEYRMAQNQAMQRIRIPWRAITTFKSDLNGKAVTQYLKHLVANRIQKKFVKREFGEFINVWINLTEAEGKIGNIHPESSDAFPLNQAQRRDTLMEIAENPLFQNIITDPGNAQTVESIMGIQDLKIPGAADRDWQMREIKEMLENPQPPMPPMPPGDPSMAPPGEMMPPGPQGPPPPPGMPPPPPGGDPMMQQDPMMQGPQSTVPPNATDNHEIHMAIVEEWAKSEKGWDAKKNNPDGWANVQAHWTDHKMMMQQEMMQDAQMGMGPEGAPPPGEQVGAG